MRLLDAPFGDAGGLKPEVVCRPAAASPKSTATPRPAEMKTRRGARKCFAKSVCFARKRENLARWLATGLHKTRWDNTDGLGWAAGRRLLAPPQASRYKQTNERWRRTKPKTCRDIRKRHS